MSNVIKAYTIRYEDETKKTIDANLWAKKPIPVRSQEISEKEPEIGEFTEGIKALVVEPLPTQEEINAQQSSLLEEAKLVAEQIILDAKQEAEQLQNQIYESAREKGYVEGLKKAELEIQKVKDEYERKAGQLEEDYEALLTTLEPKVTGIMTSLIERITGILVEGKDEVIGYLILRALKNMDKITEFTLRVSSEDYPYLLSRKNDIVSSVGRDITLYINEDSALIKNQCRIETDLKVIDCSLDIQLNNLITDIKILSENSH